MGGRVEGETGAKLNEASEVRGLIFTGLIFSGVNKKLPPPVGLKGLGEGG